MPRPDWQDLTAGMTNVQVLVHLAMRMDAYDEDQIRVELLRERRRAYEDELTIQAQRVGCPMRAGRLQNGAILTLLNEDSRRDSYSIVNTYNRDLAYAILNIAAEVPTANRFVYAKRLGAWEERRATWKNTQIALYTENSARAMAQQDFVQYNGTFGTAEMFPKVAVCPVCIGWVARGEVPLRVAMNNPPPYHVNCPHGWNVKPEAVAKEDCPDLWMGR
jgi:hypothetical protein